MYYMRSRYYSPYLMRFINADVYTGSIENSPTLNRYAYANGNPINNIDPCGTSAQYAKVSSVGHTILDVGSYIPVVGNACDLVNGVWYATEGDYVNAALSAYSAIPGAGAAGNAVKATRDAISAAGVGFVYDISKGVGNTKKAAKLQTRRHQAYRVKSSAVSIKR